MRNRIAFLLLVVLAVFLGIVILHPLSHGLHHDGDDGHECSICLWLHNNTVFVFFGTSLLIFFTFICFCRLFSFTLPVYLHFATQFSRAPPF
ncbi:MAG: hypothetical protein PHC29_07465 [Candidatus Omnitrophica bacterium]|nr:hypothetical protein [Candidatus Omnitrophota bacterium]